MLYCPNQFVLQGLNTAHLPCHTIQTRSFEYDGLHYFFGYNWFPFLLRDVGYFEVELVAKLYNVPVI